MNVSEAREAFLKARQAFENSSGRLRRAFIAMGSRMPQTRRPVGSPASFVIPRDRFSPEPEFGDSFRLARFDPKTGRLAMTSMRGMKQPWTPPEVDPESFMVDVWDRVAFELHLNCFAAYVEALFQYARLAPNAEELGPEKDALRAAIAASMRAGAEGQVLGAGEHSRDLSAFADALCIDRTDKALREYQKLKSPESAIGLMTVLAETMLFHSDLEKDPTLMQAQIAVNEYLSREMK